MSIRNLDRVFRPESIVLVGASVREGSVGAVLTENLMTSGFDGPVLLVNPRQDMINGVRVYPDVSSLPLVPDLAVISTPPDTIPEIVGQLAALGTKAAVVITAGFGESPEQKAKDLQQAMLDAARPHLLRIIGPNCLGILVPRGGINASFMDVMPKTGGVAFVTQSGAIVTAILDWAQGHGIGFSHIVSLGDMVDVDFGDMLDYLANDPETKTILLYIEGITASRKFMSAARAASRLKPVVVVKAGRHEEGAHAVASHTGALAGADAVYDAAFRRAGMLRVYTLEELFDATETLAKGEMPKGDRVAIVTNGGGAGILAIDALIDEGGHAAVLSDDTISELSKVLPPTWSRGNPVDIIGDAPGSRYRKVLDILANQKGVDAILVLHCPIAVASPTEAAAAVIDVAKRKDRPALLTNWLGDRAPQEARQMFIEHNIPTYDTPAQAARAFMHMVNHRRSQQALLETPLSIPEAFDPDTAAARSVIEHAIANGREWLTLPESMSVLSAYAIPVVPTYVVKTEEGAAQIADEIGGPVALKILSQDIVHKSDVGGVALDLPDSTSTRTRAHKMMSEIRKMAPKASMQGFTVQPMIHRPASIELIAGAATDSQFGPVILFGHGGTAVEVLDDKAIGLPPLNLKLARDMISRTRVTKLLSGYRTHIPADLDAIALTLIKISQLVSDISEIDEIDINPLLADENGVLALDARIKVSPAHLDKASDRLAICPYPKELEEIVLLDDQREIFLRPIMPEDEPALRASFDQLSLDEIRMGFFGTFKTLPHDLAARLTQIDYDREMAITATESGTGKVADIFGVVRIAADPDNEKAEFAIFVRHDMTSKGLGTLLMQRIIAFARRRGIRELFGDVLHNNMRMLKLASDLGFKKSQGLDPEIVRVSLKLQ